MPFKNCFFIYLKLCFFSASPEQLPWSWFCIAKSLIVYCLVSIFLLDVQSSVFDVVLKILIELGLILIILQVGLKITKQPERFHKALSAFMGVGMIVSLISVPFYTYLLPDVGEKGEISQALIYLTIIILVWNLAIISEIFKRTFNITTFLAFVVTFNYFISFQLLILALFTS